MSHAQKCPTRLCDKSVLHIRVSRKSVRRRTTSHNVFQKRATPECPSCAPSFLRRTDPDVGLGGWTSLEQMVWTVDGTIWEKAMGRVGGEHDASSKKC